MDTKITQEPQIAAQILRQVLGSNPDGVTINVISIGTITMHSPTQDNSNNKRQIEHKLHGNLRYKHTTKDDIVKALAENAWNQTLTAKSLGIPLGTMRQRVRSMGGMDKLKEGQS